MAGAPLTPSPRALQVDPRVGAALDDMNNAMCAVNDLEAALTQAKRRARQVESEQKQLCQARCACSTGLSPPVSPHAAQAAYDKLSRGVKEALPVYNRQVRESLPTLRTRSVWRSSGAPRSQVLAKQQQTKAQRAFTEYQRAHDAHVAAKAAIAALEGQLMASSGAWPRSGRVRLRAALLTAFGTQVALWWTRSC